MLTAMLFLIQICRQSTKRLQFWVVLNNCWERESSKRLLQLLHLKFWKKKNLLLLAWRSTRSTLNSVLMVLKRANIATFAKLLLWGPKTSTGIVVLAISPSVMDALSRAKLVLSLLLLLLLFLVLLALRGKREALKNKYWEDIKSNQSSKSKNKSRKNQWK